MGSHTSLGHLVLSLNIIFPFVLNYWLILERLWIWRLYPKRKTLSSFFILNVFSASSWLVCILCSAIILYLPMIVLAFIIGLLILVASSFGYAALEYKLMDGSSAWPFTVLQLSSWRSNIRNAVPDLSSTNGVYCRSSDEFQYQSFGLWRKINQQQGISI